jgi:hypothetical protein
MMAGSLGSYFGLARNFSACAFLALAAAVCRSKKLFPLKMDISFRCNDGGVKLLPQTAINGNTRRRIAAMRSRQFEDYQTPRPQEQFQRRGRFPAKRPPDRAGGRFY